MRTAHKPLHSLLCVTLALVACGSAPKPATVDPSARHPVNASVAVELQVCKGELTNARIRSTESDRVAESSSAASNYLIAQQRALLSLRETPSAPALPAPRNSVYTVRFEFGSSQVDIPERTAQVLIAHAKLAPLIMLRGRTDGTRESAAESHIARERAWAVRNYLIAQGVEPARIRATYQAVGDQAADNNSSAGRSINRRVEIELYSALPASLETDAPAL